MGRIAPGKAPFNARMAMIGEAILIRHHPDDFVARSLGLEGTADPAIAAGGDNRAIGAALLEHVFSISASVGQACTQAPQETHSESI